MQPPPDQGDMLNLSDADAAMLAAGILEPMANGSGPEMTATSNAADASPPLHEQLRSFSADSMFGGEAGGDDAALQIPGVQQYKPLGARAAGGELGGDGGGGDGTYGTAQDSSALLAEVHHQLALQVGPCRGHFRNV